MYKCSKCGHEFEGNFCPSCGTKRQEKKKNKNNRDDIINTVLVFTPTMLFALLALLMWVLLAIPVVYNIWDDKVYSFYSFIGDNHAVNALLSFTVIGFVLAVFAALVLFLPVFKKISFKIKNFRIDLNMICAAVEWLILFSLFVTSACLCHDANCASAGIILSFSLIFLIISVGAFVVKLLFFKECEEENDGAKEDSASGDEKPAEESETASETADDGEKSADN